MSPKPIQSLGWINGQWIESSKLSLPIDDAGLRQGVIAVERLRTYHGRLFQSPTHLQRFFATIETLSIKVELGVKEVAELLSQLLIRNQALLDQDGDIGITVLATPGSISRGNSTATLLIHPNQIDHRKLRSRQLGGQPVWISDTVQPPPTSWSRQIKVRSRVHYYLADQAAREQNENAVALLVDQDGSVTETSIANVAIVRSSKIYSPAKDRVLNGVTQTVIESIAKELAIDWQYETISPDQVRQCDELLLMGTDGGIWWGWDVQRTGSVPSDPGPIFVRLRQQLDQFVTK
ncbi:aminotransferase class IV [Stieleria marina]|uniref:aminotransferase class IV n=1 Tax=Stieleria marina TaxID=1930275 RepID=UPI003AF37835